jgi:hypothetical protein
MAMQQPIAAKSLIGMKSATKAALEVIGRTKDFPGCYVFMDEVGNEIKPIYVGISRRVVRRLTQHLNTNTHHSATFAYRMACADFPHTMKRSEAMDDELFDQAFLAVKERMQRMRIAFIEIENDLELYLFEAYAAMELDTATWNTFRTH